MPMPSIPSTISSPNSGSDSRMTRSTPNLRVTVALGQPTQAPTSRTLALFPMMSRSSMSPPSARRAGRTCSRAVSTRLRKAPSGVADSATNPHPLGRAPAGPPAPYRPAGWADRGTAPPRAISERGDIPRSRFAFSMVRAAT